MALGLFVGFVGFVVLLVLLPLSGPGPMLLFCVVGECSRNGAAMAEMPETASARIPTSFRFIGVMFFFVHFLGSRACR